MKHISKFIVLFVAVCSFSVAAAEKKITQEDFQKILKQFEKEYNESKTMYQFLTKIPSFSSFDYALIGSKVNLDAAPPKVKVDTLAMTVTFASGVVLKWTSPMTGDFSIDNVRYQFNPALPLGGYLSGKKMARLDIQLFPQAEAQQDKEKTAAFPLRQFWQGVSEEYKNASLAIADKKPDEAAATGVGGMIAGLANSFKTSLRGDSTEVCAKKAEVYFNALVTSKLSLKGAKCGETDLTMKLGKELASFYDKTIADSPDKAFTFELRMPGNPTAMAAVDLEKGFFYYTDKTGTYNYRFENGKVLGIAEVETSRMLEVTEDQKGKPTADPRAVRNAKINKYIVDRKLKSTKLTTSQLIEATGQKLNMQCMPEVLAKPYLSEESKVVSPGSAVPAAPDPVSYSKSNYVPKPIYTNRNDKICDYSGKILKSSDRRYNHLKDIGDRFAVAFQSFKENKLCEDSCKDTIVAYLSQLDPLALEKYSREKFKTTNPVSQ